MVAWALWARVDEIRSCPHFWILRRWPPAGRCEGTMAWHGPENQTWSSVYYSLVPMVILRISVGYGGPARGQPEARALWRKAVTPMTDVTVTLWRQDEGYCRSRRHLNHQVLCMPDEPTGPGEWCHNRHENCDSSWKALETCQWAEKYVPASQAGSKNRPGTKHPVRTTARPAVTVFRVLPAPPARRRGWADETSKQTRSASPDCWQLLMTTQCLCYSLLILLIDATHCWGYAWYYLLLILLIVKTDTAHCWYYSLLILLMLDTTYFSYYSLLILLMLNLLVVDTTYCWYF